MDLYNKYFINVKVKNDNYKLLGILFLILVTSYLDIVWIWFYSFVIYYCYFSIVGVYLEI